MPLDDVFYRYFSNVLDIALVWFVIYRLILVVQGTKAVQLLKGITVIICIRIISQFLNLHTLGWLTDQALIYGFLAIIIIFQPEVRRTLEQLGRGKIFSRSGSQREDEVVKSVNAISKATEYMAKRRIGALISIERETGMGDYIETGIQMKSVLSSELLINIFIPNTPLHDGAVIIKKNEIMAAGCYLPLSESGFISKELGTRHRAALGISEVTDSLTIIVSEETGFVSLTKNGELHRELSIDALRELLMAEMQGSQGSTSSSRWSGMVKKNG